MRARVRRQKLEAARDLIADLSYLNSNTRPLLSSFRLSWLCLFAVSLFFSTGCALKASPDGIPPQAQAAIDAISGDINDGSYEKIYNESAEEWRQATTPEQSSATFKTLKDKLGSVKGRSFHSATEQRNSSGTLSGHSFIITYKTTFERADGMETFTLVERDGRWLLARYFVNSEALK